MARQVKQVCERCRTEEAIPTHQFVKFDTGVQYLCKVCWEDFRRWFFHASRINRSRADGIV